MAAASIEDLRRIARKRLPRVVFDFIDGGAQDEVTLRANTGDFESLTLRPRMMVDVSKRKTEVELFGQKLAAPIVLSPVGLTGLAVPKGELHAAKAAKAAGIGYCLSTNSSVSIEEIAQETRHPFWFQLYVMKDRGLSKSMMERAKAAGCNVLVVTVDLATHGRRERDIRNGFSIPPRLSLPDIVNAAMRPGWLYAALTGPRLTFANYTPSGDQGFIDLAKHIASLFDPALSWKDIEWMKSVWGGPVVIKGILRGDDAELAIQHGADGISVSNHGGRQLDGSPSAIRALPEVVEAVRGRVPVLIDSGVRRGIDIIRARALGATAVLVGRAFVYGLAARGPSGAGEAIGMLRNELDNAMALLGIPDLDAVDRSILLDPPTAGRWPSNA